MYQSIDPAAKNAVNAGSGKSEVRAMNERRSGRREFLKTALGAGAGVSLACMAGVPAFARKAAESIAIKPVTDSIALVTGAGCNVVTLTGGEGVLMVDGGLADRSGDLFNAITKHTGAARPSVLFNTHWHWDHTGANERAGKAGVKIIAHENTKLWLGADFIVQWEQREYKPRPRVAWPTETFYTDGKLAFGGQRVEYGYLPRAHTDGDIYVRFPDQNVLVVGDLLSVEGYPILDVDTGGWLGGAVDATQALIDLADDETVVVPGKGRLATKADLVAQHQMLSTMRERLVGLMRKGQGTDDLLAAPPTAEFDEKWGDPKLFLVNAYRGLWGHVRELGGIV